MSLRLTAREYAQLRKSAPTLASIAASKRKAPPRKIERAPRSLNDTDRLLEVVVEVPIPPQVKQRARTAPDRRLLTNAFVSASGNLGEFNQKIHGRLMRSMTPKSTRAFEASVRAVAAAVMSRKQMAPFSCPVEMELRFCFQGDPMTWPTAPADGDLDNLVKAVKDAINKVVYVDDRLVVRSIETKECGEYPLVSFTVRPVSV
jgi:Holliday junction resolvase RusA-like endonuclease